ncbi:hypothetical protein A2801_00635 [Candidatus Woesebacteria bacterium RIFCSPHIGHO2_01_FULL_41_10]|uniref:Uncharacterized protein n=1 Tax=Candidatus Woesebacteria bacterium RIFCSPHIGHO2_01_FULL_41_10 TaxID=1802500 RepID=A0A1F7YQT8_9BACT|nr:MAG: hypothetical protein A2801_00635 [Candidatus Woesebacteria bacterium RIFCSPHIGHO2_01_FULL_41_10]
MESPEVIHVHRNSFRNEYYVVLLLIPSIVFAIVLAVLVSVTRQSSNPTATADSKQILHTSTSR